MNKSQEGVGVHRDVEWMVPADTYVLQYMASVRDSKGNPAVQRPATISDNISYSRKHIGARCRALAEKGLLEQLGRGRYRITRLGMQAADGEVSTADLTDL